MLNIKGKKDVYRLVLDCIDCAGCGELFPASETLLSGVPPGQRRTAGSAEQILKQCERRGSRKAGIGLL